MTISRQDGDTAFEELMELYRQLDFTVDYVDNTRVRYQYCMVMLV